MTSVPQPYHPGPQLLVVDTCKAIYPTAAVTTPSTWATIPIASPTPIYAWSHVPAIEQVVEIMESYTYPSLSTKLPDLHSGAMNTFDGFSNHEGIVDHGLELARELYRYDLCL